MRQSSSPSSDLRVLPRRGVDAGHRLAHDVPGVLDLDADAAAVGLDRRDTGGLWSITTASLVRVAVAPSAPSLPRASETVTRKR